MIEVNVADGRWYKAISKPKVYTKSLVKTLLVHLNIFNYKPMVFVVLANNAVLQDLNMKYRSINKATNVLSFPYEELAKNCCLGEIFISLDTVLAESEDLGIQFHCHFTHMLYHGLLHILGYDHQDPEEEKVMQSLEVDLLAKLGITNPYVPRET